MSRPGVPIAWAEMVESSRRIDTCRGGAKADATEPGCRPLNQAGNSIWCGPTAGTSPPPGRPAFTTLRSTGHGVHVHRTNISSAGGFPNWSRRSFNQSPT